MVFLILFSNSTFAYECIPSDTISNDSIKVIAKYKNSSNMSKEDYQKLRINYGELLTCPEQNYNNPVLTNKERENLRYLLITEKIDGFENMIADNIKTIDIDNELEIYKRVHAVVYGKETALPRGIQQIIQNKNKFKEDRKNECKEQYVDTTHMGPVRDQQDIGWCYAYSTADLISYHTKKTVSAVDLAILYNNFSKSTFKEKAEYLKMFLGLGFLNKAMFPSPDLAENYMAKYQASLSDSQLEGGFESEVIEIVKSKGACLESDIPSSKVSSLSFKHRLSSPYSIATKTEPDELSCQDHYGNTAGLFVNLNMQQIESALKHSSPMSALYSLRQKNCTNLVQIKDKKHLKAEVPNYSRMFNILDNQLNKNQPVVIGYDFKMLNADSSGAHSSIVVGRKYNSVTNKCEYKVRNSWGKHDHFDPSTKIKHQDGYYWVNESDLKRNLMDITALD